MTPHHTYTCRSCNGEGWITDDDGPWHRRERTCPDCRGSGERTLDIESAIACGYVTDRVEAMARAIEEGHDYQGARALADSYGLKTSAATVAAE